MRTLRAAAVGRDRQQPRRAEVRWRRSAPFRCPPVMPLPGDHGVKPAVTLKQDRPLVVCTLTTLGPGPSWIGCGLSTVLPGATNFPKRDVLPMGRRGEHMLLHAVELIVDRDGAVGAVGVGDERADDAGGQSVAACDELLSAPPLPALDGCDLELLPGIARSGTDATPAGVERADRRRCVRDFRHAGVAARKPFFIWCVGTGASTFRPDRSAWTSIVSGISFVKLTCP